MFIARKVLTQKRPAKRAFFARRAASKLSLESLDKGGVCRIKCVTPFSVSCFCFNANSIK